MSLSPTVALARDLIRRKSITPADAGCQSLIAERLVALDFNCEQMNFEKVTNLWASRGDKRPLLVFAGHTDVVPTGPLEQWQIPPFDGAIRDGMLHGRGAADMKGSIASFITACERFTRAHPRHKGAIGLLITSDEEGPARWGTRAVIDTLKERDQFIDMCIVGEPTSSTHLGDVIKVGRRGSINGSLKIIGKQGHIAYPDMADNPIHHTAPLIADLLSIEWDQGNRNFQPTSFQISNIRGGTGASNVIPGEVEIEFNIRYSPELTHLQIRETIEQVLAQHHVKHEAVWHLSGKPFETVEAELIEAVSQSVAEVTGERPETSTSGGTSDGRFIAPAGAQVVELGPVNATIHQIDEHISTDDLDQLSLIYEQVLQKLLT